MFCNGQLFCKIFDEENATNKRVTLGKDTGKLNISSVYRLMLAKFPIILHTQRDNLRREYPYL